MSTRSPTSKPLQLPRKAPPPGAGKDNARFDKAFPVWLEGDCGVASGIARNITEAGMFVETREPFPLSSRVRVTFTGPSGAELTLEAEVRYQCFINFAKPDATRAGMRGIGLRFVAPVESANRKGATLH
jgi:hypothetical protein